MPAPSGNKTMAGGRGWRPANLGIELPGPPTPVGADVESSDGVDSLPPGASVIVDNIFEIEPAPSQEISPASGVRIPFSTLNE